MKYVTSNASETKDHSLSQLEGGRERRLPRLTHKGRGNAWLPPRTLPGAGPVRSTNAASLFLPMNRLK